MVSPGEKSTARDVVRVYCAGCLSWADRKGDLALTSLLPTHRLWFQIFRPAPARPCPCLARAAQSPARLAQVLACIAFARAFASSHVLSSPACCVFPRTGASVDPCSRPRAPGPRAHRRVRRPRVRIIARAVAPWHVVAHVFIRTFGSSRSPARPSPSHSRPGAHHIRPRIRILARAVAAWHVLARVHRRVRRMQPSC